ncbi:hypothetical protein KM043_007511 [Ampulex compressa]|nr:hypothetical protein KM043_007511 [Ampulex compressa]
MGKGAKKTGESTIRDSLDPMISIYDLAARRLANEISMRQSRNDEEGGTFVGMDGRARGIPGPRREEPPLFFFEESLEFGGKEVSSFILFRARKKGRSFFLFFESRRKEEVSRRNLEEARGENSLARRKRGRSIRAAADFPSVFRREEGRSDKSSGAKTNLSRKEDTIRESKSCKRRRINENRN